MELRIGITETTYKDVYNSVTQNAVEWEEYKVKVWHGKWDEVVTFTTLFQTNTFVNFICRHYHLGHFDKISQLQFFDLCIKLSHAIKREENISTIDVARMIEEISGVEL